jgi:uncharacterized OB-fold protein
MRPVMRFDLPTPDYDTDEFWDGCREGVLRIRRCNACGAFHFYPRPFCPRCWSGDVEWVEASGHARLYTYSVVYSNDLPPWPERVPYVAAVVELDEGPRMMTNVEGCAFDDLAIGMPLVVDFKDIADDTTVAVFRPAPA